MGLGLAVAWGCDREGNSPAATDLFSDATLETGLDFVHFSGAAGRYDMAEVISPGGGLLDYDNDGDLDVYLVQGGMLDPGKPPADAIRPPRHPLPLTDRLYRNDLGVDTNGVTAPRFTDVTEISGLGVTTRYGVGVAAGDYDGDGWVDLYLTNLGANQLLRNNGDGTFEDATERAGVGDPGWSVPATFFDYDRDGDLDLFSGNYVDYPLDDPAECRDVAGARDYCGPASYPAQPDRLYRNRGDGTFEDVTAAAGLTGNPARGPRPALGAVAADLDGDGWPDLYVANDGEPNDLWVNQRDGTFRETGLAAGSAVNASGQAEGSMGVDAADFDRDGDLDLFMTHLAAESNTLFLNEGNGLFRDHTAVAGLAAPSRAHTSFGTGFLDYDNDGWLDLFAVNGAVRKIESLARAGDPYPIHEPNQLFRNLGDGDGHFTEVSDRAGAIFALSEVSRGALFGDVDNDGDIDVVVVNNNGPARLAMNQRGQQSHWVGVRPRSGLLAGNARDLPDLRVALLRNGAETAWGRVRIDGSYAGANDPRVLFGLGGSSDGAQDLGDLGFRVLWTDGKITEWRGVASNSYTNVVRTKRGGGS